jgi:hypothetical protein
VLVIDKRYMTTQAGSRAAVKAQLKLEYENTSYSALVKLQVSVFSCMNFLLLEAWHFLLIGVDFRTVFKGARDVCEVVFVAVVWLELLSESDLECCSLSLVSSASGSCCSSSVMTSSLSSERPIAFTLARSLE